jgi:MFS transporter, DHA2 family, multidrug resistance protein
MAISALTVMFSEEERPKAVGIWAATNLVAVPIGPILGGWLLSHYWWGWVFLMNAPATGAKLAVAAGFAVLGAGLGLGATTAFGAGEGFAAIWMAVAGAGTGITMTTAASAALSELSDERAGVGSGVLQALKNTGAPLGSAIIGTALTSAYVSRLHLAALPPADAAAVRQSVFGGVAVARALHSPLVLASVQAAFVHGVDAALAVSAGIAAWGMMVPLLFLPGRAQPPAEAGHELPGGKRVAA